MDTVGDGPRVVGEGPQDTVPGSPVTENPDSRPRRRSKKVVLGITGAVAAVGAGVWGYNAFIAPQEPSYAGVCVDQSTQQRIDDDECDDDHHYGHAHGWYFIPYGMMAPRIGGHVSGGSFNAPQGSSYVTGGVSSSGGKISRSSVTGGKTTTVRGGFGGSAKGSGG